MPFSGRSGRMARQSPLPLSGRPAIRPSAKKPITLGSVVDAKQACSSPTFFGLGVDDLAVTRPHRYRPHWVAIFYQEAAARRLEAGPRKGAPVRFGNSVFA